MRIISNYWTGHGYDVFIKRFPVGRTFVYNVYRFNLHGGPTVLIFEMTVLF